MGACRIVHTGKAGMKDSGNATSSAPSSLALGTSWATLSMVASRSRKTGAACAAATFTLGYLSPGIELNLLVACRHGLQQSSLKMACSGCGPQDLAFMPCL